MDAKDRETSDFSVIVDIFENSQDISCGECRVEVKGSKIMCEKGLEIKGFSRVGGGEL